MLGVGVWRGGLRRIGWPSMGWGQNLSHMAWSFMTPAEPGPNQLKGSGTPLRCRKIVQPENPFSAFPFPRIRSQPTTEYTGHHGNTPPPTSLSIVLLGADAGLANGRQTWQLLSDIVGRLGDTVDGIGLASVILQTSG